jgi:ligand-binding sensor domain-containing protein
VKVFLTVVLLYWCNTVRSQDYSYIHYELKDGLAGFTVFTACQDKEGFMWFGTELGVSRFGGTSFKNFTTNEGLPDNEILEIFPDEEGRVWFAPFKNSICYYYKGKIHNQENDSVLKKIILTGSIFSVAEDSRHNIWLGEFNKIHRITPTGMVSTMMLTSSNEPSQFTLLANSFSDTLQVLNSNKFFKVLNGHPVLIGSLISESKQLLIFHARINSNYLVWTKKNDSLFCIDLKTKAEFSLPFPSNPGVMPFASRDILALNSYSGTYVYDLRKRQLLGHFLADKNISRTVY